MATQKADYYEILGVNRDADEDAINPKVTMPLAKAWPEAPRMENAVMFEPKSESRNTVGPSDRPARKKSSACSVDRVRNAKMPM